MSNTGSSTPEISEEPDEGNTKEEIGEKPDEGNAQEEISEKPNEGNAQEEITEEPNEGKTQEEITEEPNEGNIQEDITEEPNEGDTKEDITEEPNEGNDTQEDISEKQNEGSNTKEDDTEEHHEGNTKEISEEDKGATKVTATEDHAKIIFDEFLKEGGPSKIILIGETGTGKTWIARKVSEFAVKEKLDEPIWISLDKKHDEKSFKDTIARQFSLPTSTDEREEDGENEKKQKNVKSLEEKMKEKLEAAEGAKKFVLLVLDGQLEVMEKDQKEEMGIEDYIKKKILGLEDDMNYEDTLKVLITRRESEDGDSSKKLRKFELEPFSGDEAFKLLKRNVVPKVLYFQGFEKVSAAIRPRSKPAEILMLAGTLNYFANYKYGELKKALEAASNGLPELLRYTYDEKPGNSMINCFWHSWHFLKKHGGVHYNELITNWIMEGHLNSTNQIDKAYKEGHHVLMKLIDCHMLKMQEDNIVVVEGATLKMNEYCWRGYVGTADPGLASVLKDYEEKGHEGILQAKVLEGIKPADGMMKTLCGDKKEKMISSVLIDGSRLCREVHETFFGAKRNLNLLAIFSPRLKSPKELSISKLDKLLVLMLRGSYLLKNVDHIPDLKALTVLEISGSTDLMKIPDELFDKVSKLRSLDLSGAGMTVLPDNFSNLTELRRLILRQCSSLERLPKLDKFSKLEVIDLSECTNFVKIQEKSFRSLEKLQVINFSQTKIEKLPIVKTLRNLNILLLRGCSQLSGMRMLKQVSSLKILDLSGAVNIKEIMYDCFEEASSLRKLDLSETQIQFLPSDIGNLQKLRLKGCSLLKNLPELEGHSRLEELELSGCESLVNLPSLTALRNLKILGLEKCTNLETLPDLKSLSKLEKLDLRGTKLWSEDVVESLSHITQLQILS